jgi:LysR family hydrogen peroxide-inducible transcriptional activator
MEVHQLRYVCAIADTGNFSRAAERCKIAQPSLSQQVLKLEEELGTKLFDRLGRSIRLTEAGRAFIPRARAILHQMDAARSSAADQNTDLRGSVAVGVIPTVAPYLMPRYTARFAKRYPDAKLRIVEETTSVLVEGLRDLSIDVAILAAPQGPGAVPYSNRAALCGIERESSACFRKIARAQRPPRRIVCDVARRPLFPRSEY